MRTGYGFVYYDKVVLSSPVLFDMTDDLSLSVVDTVTGSAATVTTRSSWASSIFYFKMLAGRYPLTFILQRFQFGKVPGILVIISGMMAILTVRPLYLDGAVSSPSGSCSASSKISSPPRSRAL